VHKWPEDDHIIGINMQIRFKTHRTPQQNTVTTQNPTFQERGKTTGQGDAIAPKENDNSPL
jgi:hypothetical protein